MLANLAHAYKHWNVIAITLAEFRCPDGEVPPAPVQQAVVSVVQALQAAVAPSAWQAMINGMHRELQLALRCKYAGLFR